MAFRISFSWACTNCITLSRVSAKRTLALTALTELHHCTFGTASRVPQTDCPCTNRDHSVSTYPCAWPQKNKLCKHVCPTVLYFARPYGATRNIHHDNPAIAWHRSAHRHAMFSSGAWCLEGTLTYHSSARPKTNTQIIKQEAQEMPLDLLQCLLTYREDRWSSLSVS